MGYSYDQIRSLQKAYNLDHIPSDTFSKIMIDQTGDKSMWEAGLGTSLGKAIKGAFHAKDELIRETGLPMALGNMAASAGFGPTMQQAVSNAPGMLADVGLATAAAMAAPEAAVTAVTGGVFGALSAGQHYKDTNSIPGSLATGIGMGLVPLAGGIAGRGALSLAERMGMQVPVSQGLTIAETMAGQMAPKAMGVANEAVTALQGVPMNTVMQGGQMLSRGAQAVESLGHNLGSMAAMQLSGGVTAGVDAKAIEGKSLLDSIGAGLSATVDPESLMLNAITQLGFALPGLHKTLSSSPDAKFYNQYGKTLKDYMDTRYGDAPELSRGRDGTPEHFTLTEIGHKDVATPARERAVLDRQAEARANDTGFRGPLEPVDLNFYSDPFSVVAQKGQRSEKIPVFDTKETAPLHNREEATTVLREAELLKPSENASERASGLSPEQRLTILSSQSASAALKLEVAAPVLEVPPVKIAETVTQHTQQTGSPDAASEVVTRMAKKKAEREGLTPTEVKRLDMNEMLDRMQKREKGDDPKRHVEEMKLIADKTKLMGDRAVRALDVWADWVEVGNREGGLPELSKRLGNLVRPESTWNSETNAGLWSVSGFDKSGHPMVRQSKESGKTHVFDTKQKADDVAEEMQTGEKDGREWEVRETSKDSGKYVVAAKNKMLATMTDEIADRAAMPTDVGDPVERLITVDAAKDLDAAFRMIAPLERLQGIGPFKALSETEFNDFMRTFANHVASQGLNGEEMMKAVPQFLSDWTNKRVVEKTSANMMELADSKPIFMTQLEKLFSPREVEKLPRSKSGGVFYDLVKSRFNLMPKVEQELLPGFLDWVEATGKANGGQIRPEAIVEWMKQNGPQVEVKVLGGDDKEDRGLVQHWIDTNAKSFVFDMGTQEWLDAQGDPITEENLRYLNAPNDVVAAWNRHMDRALNSEGSQGAQYSFVAPKTDMPGYVELLVRLPLKTRKLTTEESQFLASFDKSVDPPQADRDRASRLRQDAAGADNLLYTGPHFGEHDTNVIAFVRGYVDTLPDGRKTFHVIEQQSDWGQTVRKVKKAVDAGEFVPRNKQHIPSHPTLDVGHNLALKAVIKHVADLNDKARAEGRTWDVIDSVTVSDGETAMMTEGHDKQLLEYATRQMAQDKAAEKNLIQARWDQPQTHKVVENNGKFFVVKGEGGIEPPQSKGMRLHYDTTLPSAMRSLTGDKGTPVELGVHKNASVQTEYPNLNIQPEPGSPPTGSPVFRNPDGTPKTSVTGTSYDLTKVLARQATGESFSFGGKNYMLIGDKAQLSPEKLAVKQAAMRMAAEGESMTKVTLLTGWFKSAADGEWRFQSSDRYLEIRPDLRPKGASDWITMKDLDQIVAAHEGDTKAHAVQEALRLVNEQNMRPMTLPEGITVGAFLAHPELLEMYPWLKDIPVKRLVDKRGQHYLGMYEEGIVDKERDGQFGVKVDMPYGQFVDVLVHEIQHYIQGVENWARGGNPGTKWQWLNFKLNLKLEQTKEYQAWEKYQEANKPWVQEFFKLEAQFKQGLVPERKYLREAGKYQKILDRLAVLDKALEDVRLSGKFTPKNVSSKEAQAFYERIAGEIEAEVASKSRLLAESHIADERLDLPDLHHELRGIDLTDKKTFKGSLVYKGEDSQQWGVMGSNNTRFTELVSKFKAGSITAAERVEAQRLVDAALNLGPTHYWLENGKAHPFPGKFTELIQNDLWPKLHPELKRFTTSGGVYDAAEIRELKDVEGIEFTSGTDLRKALAGALKPYDAVTAFNGEKLPRFATFEDRWPGITPSDLINFVESAEPFQLKSKSNVSAFSAGSKIAVENMLLHALEMNGHTSERAKTMARTILQQFDHNDIQFGTLNDPKALGMQQTNPDGTMNVWFNVVHSLMKNEHAFMFTMAHEVNGHGLIETFKLARERLAKDPKADIKGEFGLSREHFESVKNFYDLMADESAESRGHLVREFVSLLPVEARKAVEQLLVRPDAKAHEESMADMQAAMSYLIASDYTNGRSTGRLAQLIELLPTPIAKFFTALAEWSRKFFSSLRTVAVARAAHITKGYNDPAKIQILNDYIDSLHSILRVDARNNKAAVEALRYSDFITPGAVGLKLAGPDVNMFLKRNMMESPDVERAVQILGLMPEDSKAPKRVGFFRRHAGLVSTLSVLYSKFGRVTAEHAMNEHDRNVGMQRLFSIMGMHKNRTQYVSDKNAPPQIVEKNPALAQVRDNLMRLVQVEQKKNPAITVAQLVASENPETLKHLGTLSEPQKKLVLDAVLAHEEAHLESIKITKGLQDKIAQGQYAILLKAIDKGLTVEQATQRVKQFHEAWEKGQLGVLSTGYPDVDAMMIKYFERVRKIHEEWVERRGYISEQRSGDFRYRLYYKDGTSSMDAAQSEQQMKMNIDAHKLNPQLDKVEILGKEPGNIRFQRQDLEALAEVESEHMELLKSSIEQLAQAHPELTPEVIKIITGLVDKSSTVSAQLASADANTLDVKSPKARRLAPGRENLDMYAQQVMFFERVIKGLTNKLTRVNYDLAMRDEEMTNHPAREMMDQAMENLFKPDPEATRIVQNMNWFKGLFGNWFNMVQDASQPMTGLLRSVLVGKGIPVVAAEKAIWKAGKDLLPTGSLTGERAEVVDWFKKGNVGLASTETPMNNDALQAIQERRVLMGYEPSSLIKDYINKPTFWLLQKSKNIAKIATDYGETTTFLASFDAFRAQGMDREQARIAAFQNTKEVNSSSGKSGRSVTMWNNPDLRPIAAMVNGLQNFSNGVIGILSAHLQRGFFSYGPESTQFRKNLSNILGHTGELTKSERVQARKAFVIGMGTMLAVAGALGIPGVGIALKTMEALGWNAKEDLMKALTDEEDPDNSTFNLIALHGLGNLLGFDVGAKMGVGGMLGLNPYNGFDAANLFGVTGGLIKSAGLSAVDLLHGNVGSAIERVSPNVLQRPLKLYRDGWEFRDADGTKMIEATDMERTMMGVFGVKPKRLMDMEELRRIQRADRDIRKQTNVMWVDEQAALLAEGDVQQVKEAIAERIEQDPTLERDALLELIAQQYVDRTMPYNPALEPGARSPLMAMLPGGRGQGDNVQRLQTANHVKLMLGGELPAYMRPKKPAGVRKVEEAQKRTEKNNLMMQMLGGQQPGYMGERVPTRGAQTTTPHNSLERAALFDQMLNANPRQSVDEISALLRQ